MNQFSLTTYSILAVLGIGSIVIINAWVGTQLQEPVPAQPAIAQPQVKSPDSARPPLDENGMLVPVGAPTVVQPEAIPKTISPSQLESQEKRIFEDPQADTTGDLAG